MTFFHLTKDAQTLLLIYAILCNACGAGTTEPEVTWQLGDGPNGPTRVRQVFVDDSPLLVGGGCYIIGSCSGADSPSETVTSVSSDGSTLRELGSCSGSPFSVTLHPQGKRLFAEWHIGPLPVSYTSLSIPCDGSVLPFNEYRASSGQHEVGCAGSWERRPGLTGHYSDIPRPCTIDGVGTVGLARFRPAPIRAEMSGNYRFSRHTIAGPVEFVGFHAHPFTNNIEPGWTNLPEGTVVTLHEEILVQ